MAAFATHPAVSATYDAVWTLVVVAVLVALTVVLAAIMRVLRHRAAGDALARVQALNALHASGVIGDEEYEARRERLLDQL